MIEQVTGFLRDVVVPVVIFVVLPVFYWFKRDRRKTLAETAVAERTVGVDVNAKEAGALGASVAFVQEAFRVERESKDREITKLNAKVTKLEVEQEEDKAKKAHLEHEVQELRAVVSDRDEQITALRTEVAELKMSVALLKSMTEKFTHSEEKP